MIFKKNKQIRWKLNFLIGTISILAFAAAFLPFTKTNAQKDIKVIMPVDHQGTYYPNSLEIVAQQSINLAEAAEREALVAPEPMPWINAIPAPKGTPPVKDSSVPVVAPEFGTSDALPPAPSAQGSSPAPATTFMGEQLTGGSIPPDTHGAVGTTHVMSVSNDSINIRTRDGALVQRMTLNAFWVGVTIKGTVQNPSSFDPKVVYDRFNQRFIFVTTFNAQSVNSAVGFAVSQTNDPTGSWRRYTVDADPTSTSTGGLWIDYPSLGQNKNWIVANYNTFGYGTISGYQRSDVFVLDKQAAYAGTLSSINAFQARTSTCTAPFETKLGCGFTMVPSVSEDNTSETLYLVEDWDSVNGQLRMSKVTGTPSTPMLTVGTQFPQSSENWRFNAARIGTTGGYVPQRSQTAYAVDTGSRIMANDSRLENAVLRNGSLWTSHHVMIGAAPNTPGTPYGTANPDIKTAVQWWQINPTIETGLSTPPIQRGRIFDPLADNCNSGNSTGNSTERAACTQQGQFFIFPSIAVNKDNDVLIGFTQSSPLTYPSGAYAMRRASDPANTMRDVVVYRSGASNYNIGSGSGTSRQNRWGDYSMTMVEPTNDTDFWTVQEYSPQRTFLTALGGIAAPWGTWWARVNPNSTQPTTTGNLIISEFRFRGPNGMLDEFIELYNPSTTTPFRVQSTDATQGWALAMNNGTTTTGLTVVPEGVVIPPRGHYLIGTNPVSGAASNENLYYGLNLYPGASTTNFPTLGSIRAATIDTGYASASTATDAIPDNAGVALFRTSTLAAFIAANQADAAGFAGTGTIFREGTGIPAITAGAVTGQISFLRNQSSSAPQDTNNNANDFIFVNTLAPTEPLGSTPRLGAPGPENVDSPVPYPTALAENRIDSTTNAGNSPNQVYDPAPVANGANGTVSVRRSFVNNTGRPITRLRFRITALPTFPDTPQDFRLLSSPDITVTTNDPTVCGGAAPCNVAVRGLTLEEPPAQPNGGGINSSARAGVITSSSLFPANSRINVHFVFGVQGTPPLWNIAPTAALPFNVIAEAVTVDPIAPTAASVSVSGRVLAPNGFGVRGASVRMVKPDGEVITARTNNLGYYNFREVIVGETYIFTVEAKRWEFSPRAVLIQAETPNLNFTANP